MSKSNDKQTSDSPNRNHQSRRHSRSHSSKSNSDDMKRMDGTPELKNIQHTQLPADDNATITIQTFKSSDHKYDDDSKSNSSETKPLTTRSANDTNIEPADIRTKFMLTNPLLETSPVEILSPELTLLTKSQQNATTNRRASMGSIGSINTRPNHLTDSAPQGRKGSIKEMRKQRDSKEHNSISNKRVSLMSISNKIRENIRAAGGSSKKPSTRVSFSEAQTNAILLKLQSDLSELTDQLPKLSGKQDVDEMITVQSLLKKKIERIQTEKETMRKKSLTGHSQDGGLNVPEGSNSHQVNNMEAQRNDGRKSMVEMSQLISINNRASYVTEQSQVSRSKTTGASDKIDASTDHEANAARYEQIPEEQRDKNYLKKGDDFWSKRNLQVTAGWLDICCLSLAMILSAVYFSWNLAFEVDVVTFMVASVLCGTAFMILTCCLGEMVSSLPFSGGSYGFARATMGKVPGVVVGLAETAEYILTTAVNMLLLSIVMCNLFETSNSSIRLLIIFIAYVISLGIQIAGGRFLWNFTVIITVVNVAVLALYWFGNIKFLHHFESNAVILANPEEDPATLPSKLPVGTMYQFMQVIPLAIWWYVGVEAIPLCSEEVVQSKVNVPKGMVASMVIVCICSLMTFFVCTATPFDISGGEFADVNFPLISGFQSIFQSPKGINEPLLNLLLIPGVFSSAYSFIFAYGRQMFAMSRSGLLPTILSLTHSTRGTPWVAMLAGSALGFVICAFACFDVGVPFAKYQAIVYNFMLMVALFNYVVQLCCFIILRVRYRMLTRKYRFSLGVPGAVVAIIIFTTAFIGVLGFTDPQDVYIAVCCCFAYFGTGLAYYFLHSSKQLIISPEEQFAMFMLYSIKFIRDKQERVKNRKKYKYQPDKSEGNHRKAKSINAKSSIGTINSNLQSTTPKHSNNVVQSPSTRKAPSMNGFIQPSLINLTNKASPSATGSRINQVAPISPNKKQQIRISIQGQNRRAVADMSTLTEEIVATAK